MKTIEKTSEGNCALSAQKEYSISAALDRRQNVILEKTELSDVIRVFTVHCPQVAWYGEPGQFVIVRQDEFGERVPLTIADFHREEGWVTLVVQIVGAATRRLDEMAPGDALQDIVGPLGHESEIDQFGTVVCIGGGLGIAPVFPIQRALKQAGNRVLSVMGARSRNLVFWEDRMRACADELYVTTDDGSYGEKGFVTSVLQRLIESEASIDRVIAIGPPPMMRAVANVTRPAAIKTIVSLNSIMVDGTGMCGGCRVVVGGEARFTCVDGPEFDAHEVDFDLLFSRLATYRDQEAKAHTCSTNRGPVGSTDPAAPAPSKNEAADEAIVMDRRAKHRIPAPEQAADRRRRNFDEVALTYSPRMAQAEAIRCLQCKKPRCVHGCPVEIDIPEFIGLIAEGHFLAAAKSIKKKNSLPAICGRVCPQETQCEELCVIGKKGEPVAIGRLERFAADYEARFGFEGDDSPELKPPTGKRVAIVGAGPAGLTCGAELALLGHKPTIYEALHAPGGVLIYGIPEFRLPKVIVQRECDYLEKLGVEFRMNTPIGAVSSVPELLDHDFDAVFIGTGAGLPTFMNIPGENLKGVYSANEFLTRANLMKAYRFPEYDTPVLTGEKVAVTGGGNVAMDAARSALRLGAGRVFIVYRRTRKEMPARDEEIEHAVEEGVELLELTTPIEVLGNAEGWVSGLRCLKMELGEPDASGRRRPVPIEGSEHVLDVDQFVVAIGQGPNPLLTKKWPELELNAKGNIATDDNLMTNIPGVFAGGDIVTGAATVILAMSAGKRAAQAIDQYLASGSSTLEGHARETEKTVK